MTESIDQITHAMGPGFLDGINRSKAISGVVQSLLQGKNVADQAALQAALTQVRIGSELLNIGERTARHNADMAAKQADTRRKDAKHDFDVASGRQANQREERLNAARVHQVNRLDLKIQLEALLAVRQSQRQETEHRARVDTTRARTQDVQTQTGIRLADFEAREQDRDTQRAHTANMNDANLTLVRDRNTREGEIHDLRVAEARQRMDFAARGADLSETIARDNSAHHGDSAAASAFAASKASAGQGPRQRQRAQHFEDRFAADTDSAHTTTTEPGPAAAPPAPDRDARIADDAEEVTLLNTVADLDAEDRTAAVGPEDGSQIGETVDAAFATPGAAAEVDVSAGMDVSAPDPRLDIDAGPGVG
ncbi:MULTISPECIES: hypothetical protein [Nocardia]|uniref:hypothetical protein n=1 Tax=Nocardia TaxID=1817 RepID=UPI0013005A02|nr:MULTISPECIES: hypothetical protein [Nocardia]